MILLCALAALAAGCGDGGGGAPGVVSDAGQSQAPPDSSEPTAGSYGERPGAPDSGGLPGAADPNAAQGEAGSGQTGGSGSGQPQSGTGSSAGDLRISGAPPAKVLTETPFSFKPTVHNPGGHALTFSAVKLPRWAALNAATGEISGTPKASDVGAYTGIQITVRGGGRSRTSRPYAIHVVDVAPGSVTLNWTPPTQNADGTPLTDLAGFKIVYGLTPNALTRSVTIDNAGASSVVIENLTANVWHFGARAFNKDGVESAISNLVRIRIM